MAGLEVEGLWPAAPATKKIVVGRVLEVVKHPDADKLNVCQVDAGTGATLNIVCGAPNVKPGIKVPVALVGAELPPPKKAARRLRSSSQSCAAWKARACCARHAN
jgi:phenylalanyl-tRNA synthetase beta chain